MPIPPPSPKLSWITEARYWRVTNASSMPCRLSRSKMWPRQGLLTIDTIGFGRLIVSGLRRLPSPPAMTTACMRASLGAFGGDEARLEALHVDVVEGGLEIVRGLLERHRLPAVQRGLVAVEAVGARALVVAVERLLELID